MTTALVADIQRALDILLRNGAREVYVLGAHARGDAFCGMRQLAAALFGSYARGDAFCGVRQLAAAFVRLTCAR